MRILKRLILLFMILVSIQPVYALETHWYNYEEGRLAAGVNNKPILIDFYADWCSPCIKMEKETYPDSRVVSEMSDFIGIKVDTQKRIDVETKYLIEYYPTIVFLNSKGGEISRHIGYLGPEEMVLEIEKARNILKNNHGNASARGVEKAPATGIISVLSVLSLIFLLSRRK